MASWATVAPSQRAPLFSSLTRQPYLFTQDHGRLMQAPHLLKFIDLDLNRSNAESVQGFHSGWGFSGLGGEDGKYGFDSYMRKQTSCLNWARQAAME